MNEQTLDQLQRAAFDYFPKTVNPVNGLVADTSREDSPASIGVVGFALSTYPVAVKRGPLDCELAQAFGLFGAQTLSYSFARDGIEVQLNIKVVQVRERSIPVKTFTTRIGRRHDRKQKINLSP